MKTTKALLALVFLVFLSSAPAYAWAHHGSHVHWGVTVGGPLWYGPGYYAPYYYPPYYYAPDYYPPISMSPPVYIERGEAEPAPAQQQAYWYYCAEAKGYYPYVKECPGGWQSVSPQPPPR